MEPPAICLPKAFFLSRIWSQARSFSWAEALIDMMAMGALKPTSAIVDGVAIDLDKGEFVASVRELAHRWGWKKYQVERFQTFLKTSSDFTMSVRIEPRTQKSVIKILTEGQIEKVNGVHVDSKVEDSTDSGRTVTGQWPDSNRTVSECPQEEQIVPQPRPVNEGKKRSYELARIALHWLNQRSGKNYREVATHLDPIAARIAEVKMDIEGVKTMIERQAARWMGTEWEYCLRPKTLFRASNFAEYYDCRNLPVEKNGKPQQMNLVMKELLK